MKVYIAERKNPNVWCFTFPLVAEIDADLVAAAKLAEPLEAIARQLAKQHSHPRNEIIGVEFHSFEFSFLLGEEKKKDGRVAE